MFAFSPSFLRAEEQPLIYQQRSTGELAPLVYAFEADTGYGVRLRAPEGCKIRYAPTTCEPSRSPALVFTGTIHPNCIDYLVRRRTVIYSEPSRAFPAGFLPAGSVVRGGHSSSGGWIALDDDESWAFDDGSLTPLTPDRAQHFEKRVELPKDAAISRAVVQQSGGQLVVRVPRALAPSPPRSRDSPAPARPGSAPQAVSRPPPSPPSPPSAPSLPPSPPPFDPGHFDIDGHANAQQAIKKPLAEQSTQEPAEPAPSPLRRGYSTASQAAVQTLDECERKIDELCRCGEEAQAVLAEPPIAGLPAGLRTVLATLWSSAAKEEGRLDSLITSELNSGKTDARAKRKELICRTQCLIEGVEAQVKRYDEIADEMKRRRTEEAHDEARDEEATESRDTDPEVLCMV